MDDLVEALARRATALERELRWHRAAVALGVALVAALRLNSPALQFLDGRGIARSGLTTFNDDAGVAVISGADGKSPGLVLYGKDRTIVWSAP